jgi:hypothetical protein
MEKFKMPKYETKYCTGFWLPDDPAVSHVDFMDVKIALESWDDVEDHEDQSIFFYMDGEPLEEGLIVSDGFVIIKIAEE